jgi:hypothetical protein
MRSVLDANHTDHDWIQVSSAAPCPICGSGQRCRIHADEAFACCTTQPSDWRLSNGGWLHRVELESHDVAVEMEPSPRLRESGIVVRDAPGRWFSDVVAAGSGS